MEVKELIEHLHEWHENLISELCADDVLTCDDLCGYPGPCIVTQTANALEAQQKRIAELEAALREDAQFTPGMPVWVIERDEDGSACESSGYVFLAKVGHAVILTPRIYGLCLEEMLDYYIDETRDESELPLAVFPVSDCFIDKEAAKEALLTKEG